MPIRLCIDCGIKEATKRTPRCKICSRKKWKHDWYKRRCGKDTRPESKKDPIAFIPDIYEDANAEKLCAYCNGMLAGEIVVLGNYTANGVHYKAHKQCYLKQSDMNKIVPVEIYSRHGTYHQTEMGMPGVRR